MPVEQPVLDTNYKRLKIIRTWPKTTIIKTIITISKRERERERERVRVRVRESERE